MNLFRNIWRPMDRPSTSSSIPAVYDGSTGNVPGRSSGGPESGSPVGHRQSSQSHTQSQSRRNPTQPHSSNQQLDPMSQYSPYSTQGPFQTRMFVSENFMLGAGVVIIQPSSGKVVIIQDGDHWFLPKGRKDLGESIEHAALREAYEEVRLFIPFYLFRSRFDPRSPVRLPM